ncbi:Z-ring formation inhibitor MciZ [Bacillus luteolus]|uniref:Z-ring formation inhibitor MciZ n=1 Tax=Litchfieldia luteola TaxID=682179 RepID=A0ABR9QPG8_9BACI|nr:Z-ring formation inhibitor MciZ [Cytobacillus luteolus]MBP1942048.1 putative peroxiredoxin [Cytobacillus luteolus]
MKIYITHNGITLVGKAWEIRAKLKEYSKQFDTVQEWIQSSEMSLHHQQRTSKKNGIHTD